jgi:hypothetical protein
MQVRRFRYTIDWVGIALGGLLSWLVKDLPSASRVLNAILRAGSKHKETFFAVATVSITGGVLYLMSVAAIIIAPAFLVVMSDNMLSSASFNFPPTLFDYEMAGALAAVTGFFTIGSMRSILTSSPMPRRYSKTGVRRS